MPLALDESVRRAPILAATARQRRRQREIFPLSLLAPAVLLVSLVSVLPIVYAIDVSLYRTFYLKRVEFIGLANYLELLRDPAFLNNLVRSLLFVFGSLALAMPLATVLALVLNQDLRARTLFRTIIVLPWIMTQVVVALLWAWLYNMEYGPLNYIIRGLGFGAIEFLSDPGTSMLSLIVANVWRSFPFPMVLVLAALQGVPLEVYEAAWTDGASTIACFFRITLPLIASTLLITTIVLSLQYFNLVTLILVLTAGGPARATETLSLRTFNEGFGYFHVGLASAISVVIFLLNIVFSLLYMKVLRGDEGA
ncbi:MAG: sugar ABC transporter permease [Candidatus Rokubacteria bacterium]|nr:sugar ABC transporter permease [Candidatus Rokubacteria bacterium]